MIRSLLQCHRHSSHNTGANRKKLKRLGIQRHFNRVKSGRIQKYFKNQSKSKTAEYLRIRTVENRRASPSPTKKIEIKTKRPTSNKLSLNSIHLSTRRKSQTLPSNWLHRRKRERWVMARNLRVEVPSPIWSGLKVRVGFLSKTSPNSSWWLLVQALGLRHSPQLFRTRRTIFTRLPMATRGRFSSKAAVAPITALRKMCSRHSRIWARHRYSKTMQPPPMLSRLVEEAWTRVVSSKGASQWPNKQGAEVSLAKYLPAIMTK
jgi:hypothetical protein